MASLQRSVSFSASTSSLDDVKQRIKTRVPLDVLIGETVTLVRRGPSITACCPFHAEKTPSFHVYADQHYYCYGCKENGDAITFVRKTRDLSFVDALKFLASKFGIEAPELEESETLKRRRGDQAVLSQMMVVAQEIFTAELRSERGAPARDYLLSRGFSAANIEAFGFGLTPAETHGLVRQLRGRSFRDDDMVRASLGSTSAKTGQVYDFFRDRIMIPIRDGQGRIIGFGGRTTVNDPAKYKNSGATPLFDKSSVLFGLDRAKDAIKDRKQAIVVEGYMDALCLWQEGIGETVASMGTALTIRQLRALYQQTKVTQVFILFDGDQAGQKATLSAIDVVLEIPELSVRAASLTDDEDPDTFVRRQGVEALRQLLAQAVDLIDVAIVAKLKGATLASIPSIVSQDFVPWLTQVQDPIKRGYLANRISTLTGVPNDVLHRELRAHGHAIPLRQAVVPETLKPTRVLSPVEQSLMGHLFFAKPGEIDLAKVEGFMTKELPLEPLWELFARKICQSLAAGLIPKDDPQLLASFSTDDMVILAQVTDRPADSFVTDDRNNALSRLINEQKRYGIQQSIAILKKQVQLTAAQSPEDVPILLTEVMNLSKALGELSKASEQGSV